MEYLYEDTRSSEMRQKHEKTLKEARKGKMKNIAMHIFRAVSYTSQIIVVFMVCPHVFYFTGTELKFD